MEWVVQGGTGEATVTNEVAAGTNEAAAGTNGVGLGPMGWDCAWATVADVQGTGTADHSDPSAGAGRGVQQDGQRATQLAADRPDGDHEHVGIVRERAGQFGVGDAALDRPRGPRHRLARGGN
jgi:hypothetical protein